MKPIAPPDRLEAFMNAPAALLALLLAVGTLAAQDAPIDWERARELHRKALSGAPLSTEERAYYERAKAQRMGADAARANSRASGAQRPAPERLIPLTDLGADGRYEGQDGGLYGGGRNTPPDAHRQTAEAELAKIKPLNANGEPDENGTIGFVSISMSNATQEFARFKQVADKSPLKSPKVTIVDCAQGGQAMAEWAPADARPWEEARRRLAAAKVSPQQVQVAWIKLANKSPSGSLEEHGRKLERDTLAVLHNARALFPNLRIAYLGSRTYGGYANGNLNPEPYAYESAFAARWLIERQIKGDAQLALSKSPLLLWGPYLWAEGTKGRKSDSLVWERSDFVGDGVHPSDSGRQKVAELLLNFLSTDPLAKTWFSGK
jgi:lysophospholipase L1-like esterase